MVLFQGWVYLPKFLNVFCFQMSLFKNGVVHSVTSLFSITNAGHWHMTALKKRRWRMWILPFEILKSDFHQLIHSDSAYWKYQALFYGLRHAGITTRVPTWWKGNYFRILNVDVTDWYIIDKHSGLYNAVWNLALRSSSAHITVSPHIHQNHLGLYHSTVAYCESIRDYVCKWYLKSVY